MILLTQLQMLIPMLSSVVSSMDSIEFECSSKKTIDIKYTKNDKDQFPSLEYFPPKKTQIKGKLYQEMEVTGGNCFDLIIRGNSNMNECTDVVKLNDSPTPKTLETDFKNLHMCQDIAMQRFILYDEREPYQYKEGDLTPLGDSMEDHNGQLTCYHTVGVNTIVTDKWLSGLKKCEFDLGTYSHNPLKEWLQAYKDEGFPGFKIGSKSVSVDWGLAEQFKCNSTIAKIKSIQLEMKHDAIVILSDARVSNLSPTVFFPTVFENFKLKKQIDLRCLPWKLRLDMRVEMLKFKGQDKAKAYCQKIKNEWSCNKNFGCSYLWESCEMNDPFYFQSEQEFLFEKTFDEPQLKLEDVTLEYDLETLSLSLKGKNMQCLDNRVNVAYIIPRRTKTRTRRVLHIEHKIDLNKLMPYRDECVEYQVKLDISSIKNTLVWSGLFSSTMTVGFPRVEDGTMTFDIIEDVYKKCKANLFINCTSGDGNITVFKNEGLNLQQSRVQGLLCRAKAYIYSSNQNFPEDLNYKSFSDCFADTGTPCAEKRSIPSLFFGLGNVGGALAIAFMAVVIVAKIKNRRSVIYHKIKTDCSPSHIIFHNSEALPEDLDTALSTQDKIVEEYRTLETYVRNHVDPDETTEVAKSELNSRRNRYLGVVPNDSNLVRLSKETGNPKSKYINASWVVFAGVEQQFLAVQAPKPEMFSGFWQLVVDQNVSLIIMITKLVENQQRKAHQYWPDEVGQEIKMEHGIMVKYEQEEVLDGIFKRQFTVAVNGNQGTVEQLHCTSWPDMEAPKDTKTLLDLFESTEEVLMDSPGKVLVHCSAGVGRTGTYIGLFKLIKDYQNQVAELDPFETVLTMRRQRVKMVQKPMQYRYMMKCLADYVASET